MPHLQTPKTAIEIAVVTLSDTRTLETDVSGNYLQTAIEAARHRLVERHVIRDEPELIETLLLQLIPKVQVIVTTGGTGIAGRDATIPVVKRLIEKPLPGFGELFRMLSYPKIGPAVILSRATGGVIGQTLIFALPGSPDAAQTGWELLAPNLSHFVHEVSRQTPKGQSPSA